ncbi:uncharacterized protein LOC112688866 [Sipha flava]|uniref:Uncharacterized protein LOC112688866 n=1 Tax=Sipha flava TaxID=143950 RepID=A0A8B8G545_9HEMI|nr:uncharacterized protein LOC112688866 [Sipha flava]
MDVTKAVEMLEKIREAVMAQGSMGCLIVDDVRKVGVAQLRAEPILWAAYYRGWADRTTNLVRSLGSSAARLPGTSPTTKPPRPSTHHRVSTTKAMGSKRAKPATGAAPAGRSTQVTRTAPAVRTTPAIRGATTNTTPPRQATSSAWPQRDVTWVRPAPGCLLVPRMPPADPHPPTLEWMGMPAAWHT